MGLFLTASFVFIAFTYFSPVKIQLLKNKRVNILLLGISETDNARLAEVINLISYEPVTGFLDIVSIPRDTMIPVPYEVTWKQIQKLDEIYSRYYRHSKSSIELFNKFKNKLEKFLENYTAIDYYVQIDYKAFVDFIDALGGLEQEVLNRMDYDDNAQGLHIHISTGIKHFNGEQALEFVRYRDKIRGDIGRQDRQHKFLKVMLEKLRSPSSILKAPALVKSIINNVDTNLSYLDLVAIVDELRNIELKNFRIQKIPGEPVIRWRKSYWKVNREGCREVMDVVKNSQLINLPLATIDKNMKISTRITAEVWNATRRSDLARNLTEYLRKRNIDVVRYGNFGSSKKYTQIVSRTGDLNPAREVSRIMGCRNIKTELDYSRMVDINIVIGDDFKPLWKK
jgi:LCP family protein required for cell wall assembly